MPEQMIKMKNSTRCVMRQDEERSPLFYKIKEFFTPPNVNPPSTKTKHNCNGVGDNGNHTDVKDLRRSRNNKIQVKQQGQEESKTLAKFDPAVGSKFGQDIQSSDYHKQLVKTLLDRCREQISDLKRNQFWNVRNRKPNNCDIMPKIKFQSDNDTNDGGASYYETNEREIKTFLMLERICASMSNSTSADKLPTTNEKTKREVYKTKPINSTSKSEEFTTACTNKKLSNHSKQQHCIRQRCEKDLNVEKLYLASPPSDSSTEPKTACIKPKTNSTNIRVPTDSTFINDVDSNQALHMQAVKHKSKIPVIISKKGENNVEDQSEIVTLEERADKSRVYHCGSHPETSFKKSDRYSFQTSHADLSEFYTKRTLQLAKSKDFPSNF